MTKKDFAELAQAVSQEEWAKSNSAQVRSEGSGDDLTAIIEFPGDERYSFGTLASFYEWERRWQHPDEGM